jgi:hypothetical protein
MNTPAKTSQPASIHTTDQNTGRDITWLVDHMVEVGENIAAHSTWTHMIGAHRPNGTRNFMMWAQVEECGAVVRTSRPVKMF